MIAELLNTNRILRLGAVGDGAEMVKKSQLDMPGPNFRSSLVDRLIRRAERRGWVAGTISGLKDWLRVRGPKTFIRFRCSLAVGQSAKLLPSGVQSRSNPSVRLLHDSCTGGVELVLDGLGTVNLMFEPGGILRKRPV